MITEAASAALDVNLTTDPERNDPPTVLRRRARLVRHIVAMLGVPPSHVRVTDDPHRFHGTHPADLVTVYDPDPTGLRYRFNPEPSHGGLFYLLDDCPMCESDAVPVAVIATLHDLGRYLGAMGRLTAHGIDDATAPDTPTAFYGDPGHRPGCRSSSGLHATAPGSRCPG